MDWNDIERVIIIKKRENQDDGCAPGCFVILVIAAVGKGCLYSLVAGGWSVLVLLLSAIAAFLCAVMSLVYTDDDDSFCGWSIGFGLSEISMAICTYTIRPEVYAVAVNNWYFWWWSSVPGVVYLLSLFRLRGKVIFMGRLGVVLCAMTTLAMLGSFLTRVPDNLTQQSDVKTIDVNEATTQQVSNAVEEEDPYPDPKELLDAVMKSQKERVDNLLTRGVNPNSITGDRKKGLVHLATDRGSLAIVKRLVGGNADVNIRNVEKRTALYSAIYHQNAEIVEFLILSGASTNIEDKWGITPLEFAKERGCSNKILNMLKKKK